MAVLHSYGQEITNIFQLLGNKENDITKSLSWVMASCPRFFVKIVEMLSGIQPDFESVLIRNQQWDSEQGITDIEITDNQSFFIIFEAKKGWMLPGKEQLTKYSLRKDFCDMPVPFKRIVTVSECSQSYAQQNLPFHQINGITISHLSYCEIYQIALDSRTDSSNEQKHLLDAFAAYLGSIMTMQNESSNWVYVVSLGSGRFDGCTLSWQEIVKKYNKYFCPVGIHGWPKEAPNYIAFRYGGQLQSIHHIENYTITNDLHQFIPEIPNLKCNNNHFVFTLGPAIIPGKTVKTGKIYPSGRVWAMLDTLLTADSISEARDISYNRQNKISNI